MLGWLCSSSRRWRSASGTALEQTNGHPQHPHVGTPEPEALTVAGGRTLKSKQGGGEGAGEWLVILFFAALLSLSTALVRPAPQLHWPRALCSLSYVFTSWEPNTADHGITNPFQIFLAGTLMAQVGCGSLGRWRAAGHHPPAPAGAWSQRGSRTRACMRMQAQAQVRAAHKCTAAGPSSSAYTHRRCAPVLPCSSGHACCQRGPSCNNASSFVAHTWRTAA